MSGLRKLTGANWVDGGELAEGADVLMWRYLSFAVLISEGGTY